MPPGSFRKISFIMKSVEHLQNERVFKGSLHTTTFWKHTKLSQLKNIFRIFWNYFWNILEINAFQSKNVKSAVFFLKTADLG